MAGRKLKPEEASAMGKVGGAKTKQRHGREHYSMMSKRGRAALKAKYGEDALKIMAQKANEARKRKKAEREAAKRNKGEGL